MKKDKPISRRTFIKMGAYTGLGAIFPWHTLMRGANAAPLIPGLSDPAMQPKFTTLAPNALDPANRFTKLKKYKKLKKKQNLNITAAQTTQYTGLVDAGGAALATTVWGYGKKKNKVSWPGGTIETHVDTKVEVKWKNELLDGKNPLPHLLPLDPTGHWCYSLHGYTQYNVEDNGVPIVTHLHGGHSKSGFDGNPEYFFSPKWKIKGPRWESKKYTYHNDQPPGCLWYHDHSLGITRLNVYAGLAGFYIIRDWQDTGRHWNPLDLPAEEYELAYVIQDRMFRDNG